MKVYRLDLLVLKEMEIKHQNVQEKFRAPDEIRTYVKLDGSTQ